MKMYKTFVVLTFLCFFSVVHTANIFAIVAFTTKSHYVLIESLLKRLAEKGHQIDFVTHYLSNNTISRYNEISVAGSVPLNQNNLPVDSLKNTKSCKMVHFMATKGGIEVCSAVLNLPTVKNIIKTRKKYDLIITHIFGSDCMLGFSHVFNASIISIDSMVSLPWSYGRVGNIDNPSYIPNFFVLSTQPLNFFERVDNTLAWISTLITYYFLQARKSNEIVQEFFGPDTPNLNSLIQKTTLLFVNSHFSTSVVRPTVPNFVEIGGMHFDKRKTLSKYYDNLLTTNSKGIIYFTMGSSITTESFDSQKLQGMLDAFAELPYKVLWKADISKFPKKLHIPSNIHFEKWMPQFDILCHPNVKLFVSHGGLLGTYEAIYCSVPRLGIPIYADQETNILNGQKLGIAIKVAYEDINKQTILEAAKELLNDPRYRENAKRLSEIFKDRPISPLDEAVYWVDYVNKYKGAFHLRNKAADLPWFQYYCLDVVLIIFSIVLIIYKLVNFLYYTYMMFH